MTQTPASEKTSEDSNKSREKLTLVEGQQYWSILRSDESRNSEPPDTTGIMKPRRMRAVRTTRGFMRLCSFDPTTGELDTDPNSYSTIYDQSDLNMVFKTEAEAVWAFADGMLQLGHDLIQAANRCYCTSTEYFRQYKSLLKGESPCPIGPDTLDSAAGSSTLS